LAIMARASEPLYQWCSVLASSALGEPVTVKALQRGDVLGLAGADERGWLVRLAPGLSGDELLHVLMHECGHLASGHVARGVVTLERPAVGSLGEVLARRREVEQERQAEAWCEARLATVGESVRWLTGVLSEVALDGTG
jgi:hypothetical protein